MEKHHYFIEEGMLEPVRLSQKETDILVKGMEDTLQKSIHEIDRMQKMFNINTNRPSEALINQKANIQQLTDDFKKHAQTEPWIFSKCSLRGLSITK